MKTYKVTVDNKGTIRWFNEEGNLHCEHGPALIYPDGYVEYWINDKLHREDGPAIIAPDGYQAYFINGVELTEKQFESRNTKEVTMEELHKLLGYAVKIKK